LAACRGRSLTGDGKEVFLPKKGEGNKQKECGKRKTNTMELLSGEGPQPAKKKA